MCDLQSNELKEYICSCADAVKRTDFTVLCAIAKKLMEAKKKCSCAIK